MMTVTLQAVALSLGVVIALYLWGRSIYRRHPIGTLRAIRVFVRLFTLAHSLTGNAFRVLDLADLAEKLEKRIKDLEKKVRELEEAEEDRWTRDAITTTGCSCPLLSVLFALLNSALGGFAILAAYGTALPLTTAILAGFAILIDLLLVIFCVVIPAVLPPSRSTGRRTV